ncbi:methyltransferase domain-containing protein [Iodobacter sp.]|uniref:methyltransferase domain-containing protein n=1 Tax=Iodobacter sp. TaxID=1915058 RepID=UPI0025FE7F17|nr:methyltransferase domain-containing protein [Iodobacter sp.]
MMDAEKVKQLQQEFGLSYHIEYASFAQQTVGFHGKKVLEVGGSLPQRFVIEELGAAQWTALEELDYWKETLSTGYVLGTPPIEDNQKILFSSATPALLDKNYNIFYGHIEDLPEQMESQFDLIFSIAAFEHIARLPLALDKMRRALVPGGKLFTMFAPVWSCYNGHHLPEIVDDAGNHWSFGNSPIPPWGHLLFRPMELYDLLCGKCDEKTARDIVYFVYNSPHINRFFIDDYIEMVERSGFTVLQSQAIYEVPVPDLVKQQLQKQYPGRKDFSNSGIFFILERKF